jgi:hypothetical protein
LPEPLASKNAVRQRKYRQRQRNGELMITHGLAPAEIDKLHRLGYVEIDKLEDCVARRSVRVRAGPAQRAGTRRARRLNCACSCKARQRRSRYSHEQLRAILRVAAPLEQCARGAFLEEVARELAAKKSRGSLRT